MKVTKPKKSDLYAVARECCKLSKEVAERLCLPGPLTNEQRAKASMLGKIPVLRALNLFDGRQGWASILSFDLRDSSVRALELGPYDTYITMHTYLPTMLKIIASYEGTVVGLRGDGAIASFGLQEFQTNPKKMSVAKKQHIIKVTCRCGTAIVEATDIVNEVLADAGLTGDLAVGVGVDVGDIVITSIGFGGAIDLTAYGDAVNGACKLSFGENCVLLSPNAWGVYPRSSRGQVQLEPWFDQDDEPDFYVLRYPSSIQTIVED